jgi:hypothetical protein
MHGTTDKTSFIVVGFSTTNDPAKPWNVYKIPGTPIQDSVWSDYPIVSQTKEDMFFTVNLLHNGSSWEEGFLEAVIWQLNKDDGYRGDTLNKNFFNNIKYEGVVFATSDEALKAYDSGRCDAYTTDASGLYSERLRTVNPDEHMVLPEIISKEPLGPAVRKGDDQWYDIVRWTHFAMINAEELGVSKANVDEKAKSAAPEIKRLLGSEGDFGKAMGLSKDWAYRIIKHVGNYGESFERNVGQGSPLKIARGLNALWNKGGLQYAPPIR